MQNNNKQEEWRDKTDIQLKGDEEDIEMAETLKDLYTPQPPKQGEEKEVRDSMCDYWYQKGREDVIKEISENITERIQTAKTRKRVTSFQDTLFNYEVNVLDAVLEIIRKV